MELMVVVVIVGVMAALAYPNYREYVSRAKRNEAKAALLQIATNQERFFLSNNCFTGNLADVGVGATTDGGTYTVTLAADCSDFTARATYNLPDDEVNKCQWFEIDSTSNKTSFPYADCWSRTR